ncbi:phosphatase PAP2 family protein [Roseicella aerolata]|uniref:Phosphatase PAP2 family protein n=1 Tax=Roseicella aerolata TaxID=2883479 RepID=A0A9X1L9Q8_9PROT|nr:phosphatase PAP2 family protein [Roseicella aerolata]MCB4821363.1 phosphatase PAP2 family protein [Roseicella aerolata]
MDPIDRLGFDAAVTLQGDGPGAQLFMRIADQFVGNHMVKMAPLVLLLLYVWLRSPGKTQQGGVLASAELVVRGTLAIGAALAFGRMLQLLLPMRQRPRFAFPEIPFPPTDYFANLDDWSSMPSDHAMLVAAIAAVIWARSRPLAMLAVAWGLLFVSFARVYVGLHYASDVLIGYVLGLALATALLRIPLPAIAWQWLEWLEARRPALVFLGLFILGWAIGENFTSIRGMLSILRQALMAGGTTAILVVAGSCLLLAMILAGGLFRRRGQAVRLQSPQAE